MKEAGVQGEIADYKAPVILSVSTEDETGPAAELKTCLKKLEPLYFEGVVDNKWLAKTWLWFWLICRVRRIARAVVGTINAPITGFVNVMAGNLRV